MLTFKTDVFTKPLTDFMDCECFAIMSVSPVYAYVENKKTDTVIGTRYTVANPDTYVNFEVKVTSPTPVITQEKLDKSEEKFWISFVNAVVKPTKVEFGNIFCTVTADSANLETGN